MNVAEILSLARSRGIRLTPEGARIGYSCARGAMTADLKAAILANKPQLLKLLRGEHPNVGLLLTLPEGWTSGHPLEPCVACGRSTASRDPKGVPRHSWCAERR